MDRRLTLMPVFHLSQFWHNLQVLVERDNVVSVSSAVYAAIILLWLYLPHERGHIRRTLWMFSFALILLDRIIYNRSEREMIQVVVAQ